MRFLKFSCGKIRLTATLEENLDVRDSSVDLLKINWDDITVEPEGLGNGFIHLFLGQIWSVPGNPVKIIEYIITWYVSTSYPLKVSYRRNMTSKNSMMLVLVIL